MDNKNTIYSVLAIVIVAGAVCFLVVSSLKKEKTPTPDNNSPVQTLPAVVEEEFVTVTTFTEKPGPTLTRTSYVGKVKTVTTSGDKFIALENGSSVKLPKFAVTSETRIWKIVSGKFQATVLSDVKVGSKVDIQMDKEDTQDFWIFRDVYILE